MHSPRAEPVRTLVGAALLGAFAFALAGAGAAERADFDVPAMAASRGQPAVQAASAPGVASTAPEADDPRAVRVETAVEQLRHDPLLSGTHKAHRLRWVGARQEDDKPPDTSLLAWLRALAGFLNDTGRFLMWAAIAALAAILLVGGRHLLRWPARRRRTAALAAITHVRDLDVRPESLPDDVGAAAWALWQAGRIPAALSLLYRGALSRLIHDFQVPIHASATEGECLALARPRLEPEALRYVTQVVRAWEANVYGARALSAAMGEALCSGFAQRLRPAPTAARPAP